MANVGCLVEPFISFFEYLQKGELSDSIPVREFLKEFNSLLHSYTMIALARKQGEYYGLHVSYTCADFIDRLKRRPKRDGPMIITCLNLTFAKNGNVGDWFRQLPFQ